MHTVQFVSLIGPIQVLSFLVRVNLGTMAIKEYSRFPKFQRQGFQHEMVLCHFQDTHLAMSSDPSAEMQSVYSTSTSN